MRGWSARRIVVLGVVVSLLTPGLMHVNATTAASRLATETLAAINPLAPQDFGAATVNGLEYADPKEGLSIVNAPVPKSDGSVELAYQLEVPPGHGITPELMVQYGSGGENGWMGVGWDLSVGEVTIDTTFGAPRFDEDVESESYLLDGALLVPNANDDAGEAEPRVDGDRNDFSRQVENEYEEIIRHQVGTDWPADYFWEVRAKDGSVRWYGGTPDSGGPAPATPGTIDESAVVRNEAGHIVKWLLSAKRDIGVNLIRYEYETVEYEFDGTNWGVADCHPANELCGQHTYLDRILYTDATSAIADRNGPPYEIDFMRESDPALGNSGELVRADPIVDAGLGYVDVVTDRLQRVEVKHGVAPSSGTTRTYTDIAARYEFTYAPGRFGKSLLKQMIQGIADLHVHEVEYYDDLTGTTTVDGFATGVDLDTAPGTGEQGDVNDITFLDTTADVSVLGGGETNAGSGNLYVGFNPISPSKTFSFGVGLELSGGDTEAVAEWTDLNGDNLPDKVFLDGNTVKFRLNTTGASGAGAAGDWPLEDVSGITDLSKNSNFAFQVSAEAYPLVALGLGTGLGFSWSNTYFSDVNGDGLVDFVTGGTVHFNTLDADGIPTFSTSSAGTPIPLDPSPLPSLSSAELAEISETLDLQSPPIDTVRRFIAPFTGSISVAAPVELDAVGANSPDGVRVAIQHNDGEVDSAVLAPDGTTSAFASAILLQVNAGDRIYFRAGAIDDGVSDSVAWTPVITYQSPTWPQFDANGQSQWVFSAQSDFTLAGRPADFVAMPYTGTALVQGTVATSAPLTDTLTVVAVKRDPNDVETTSVLGTIPAGTAAGTFPFSQQIPVALLETPDPSDPSQVNVEADLLSVYAAVDSPVDLADIDFSGTITYAADDPNIKGDEEFEHHIRPHVELYPYSNLTSGPQQTGLTGTHNVLIAVKAPQAPDGVTSVGAVITVKSANGLLTKTATTLNVLPDGTAVTPSPIAVDFTGTANKWVEVMIRDSVFSRDGLTLQRFVTVAGAVETPVPNVALRWSGMQGIFPQPYRGWGIAGYTAGEGLRDMRMEESAFVIDPNSFPTDEPTRDDASLDEAHTEPAYAFIPAVSPGGGSTAEPVDTDRWVGPRANLYADATTVRTSRLAVDSVDFSNITAPASGGERSAPTRLGISGPGLTLSFGVGILGASAGLSPSFGLTDFEDLNGDGYPDVISTGSVSYTDQLGSYLDSRSVGRTSVTNQDLTISVNGGLSAGMVDIQPNTKGSTNAVAGDSAGKSQSASDSGPSFSLGISGSGGFSWTSPNASGGSDDPAGGTYGEQIDSLRSDFGAAPGAEIQRALADVNGDGLPDSVYTTADGVFAFYNLGYGFTGHAVKLGVGGFESRESATGGAGLGFSLPYGEFGGGVNLLFNYDWSTYSWRDVNGDGILDQLRRESPGSIKVRFGTGSGLLPAVDYGNLNTVPVSPGIDGGEHVHFDRSSGIGGGVSATAYIGPLCLVACYLVIGAGGGFNQSRSSSSVDLEDVNGDGFADSLLSLNDDQLTAALNQQNRSNLLKTVTNPLGGSFTVDYERKGNTSDHPDSIWVMKRVDIDDGRTVAVVDDGTTGDYASSFTYEGLKYDRAHRASLGFDKVTITELDTTDSDAPLRIHEQLFLNDNIFVKGLMTQVTMLEVDTDPSDGTDPPLQIRGSTVTWGFNVVRATQPIPDDHDAQAPVVPIGADQLGDDETHSIAARGWSIAPLVVAHDDYWYNAPDEPIFGRRTEFDYDGLGNVLVERDLGAPDDDFDDLTTTITYSKCTAPTDTVNPCYPQSSPRQPFWSPGTCVNWASYPTKVAVEGVDPDGLPVLLRERISPLQMCDNGAATVLRELVSLDGGTPTYATTNMTLNQYGDYALVMAPPGADGVRYTVRYTYDADRHSNVALVEEFDVPEAHATDVLSNGPDAGNATAGISSSATFDPLSGRVASRTDANGATRSHVYDEHGRIVETSTMATPGSPSTTLITFEYNANDPAYAHAIARHVDSFGGNDPAGTDDAAGEDTTATIDTVTFADGLGRVRQTKRDARLSVDGAPPINTRQVTDAADFDPLARPVVQYGPTADPGPATTFSPDAVNGARTDTSWFSYDLLESVTQPGDRTTTYEYPWEQFNGQGPLLAYTVATDPEGRVTWVGQDVRDVVRAHIDEPAPRFDADGDEIPQDPPLQTQYLVNSLGELTGVVDSTGEKSTYEYDLAGRLTRATTPNGGTVATTYDLAGRRSGAVNDAMTAVGEQTTFHYEFNRLSEIDHPGTVDDIIYEYGLDNTDGRFTAGRIRHLEDRTRLVDNSYDKNGAMVEQTAIVKRHNWRPDLTDEQLANFTYTTTWTYDDLGRIATIGYPDAKTVSFVPDGTSVGSLTSPDQLSTLLESADLDGELVSYDYDAGGVLRKVSGAEEGIQLVTENIAPDEFGNPRTVQVPRRTTHEYPYLNDRVYDPRLLAIRDEMGNGTISEYTFDPQTRWLDAKKTTAPGLTAGSRVEVQDLSYTYDDVGRPLTYDNDLPLANRAINGGDAHQQYSYDGFGRLRGASGTFDLKAKEQQRYSYGVEFTPEAPWSVVEKDQTDALVTTKGNKETSKVNDLLTYSMDRELGAPGGPLQVVNDKLTVSDDPSEDYTYDYNVNGGVDSMLVEPGEPASETNVWDREFTWTLMNQLTSANDGSELRTFAYDDTGALMIQDGNLLSRDGEVLAEHGGGPETIFLNAWVTIVSQKIYKNINDGLDKIATKMDADGSFETKSLYLHNDLVGSTNIVTDNQGRGFQRHEYFPSGEIWISDHKEEIRTPFQFGDGYYEEHFEIVLFGARWYDAQRELFLAPDPLLAADPRATIDRPGLLGAYTYAGAAPVINVDPTGLDFFGAHQRVAVKARAKEAFDLDQFVLKITGEGDLAQKKAADRQKLLDAQDRATAVLEPNALIKIDLNEGTVSLGAPYGPRKTWSLPGGNSGSKAAPSDDQDGADSKAADSQDATDDSGGPSSGDGGAVAGSARVSISDADGEADEAGPADDSAGDGDEATSSQDAGPVDQPPSPSPVQRAAAGNDDNRGDD
jgi:RHS repeat-associated protein